MYLEITTRHLGICNIDIKLTKPINFRLILYNPNPNILYQNISNNLNINFRINIKEEDTKLFIYLNEPELITNFSLNKIFNSLAIDKIYYINLKHRVKRKINIEKQLYKLGIPKSQLQYVEAVYLPNNPQIGCAFSHLKVLSDATKQNYNNILVLEDDFIFQTNRKRLDNFIENLNSNFPNWDLCLLTSINYKSTPSQIHNIKHLIKGDTTAGYLISQQCYQIIFNIFFNCTKPQVGFNTNQFAIDVAWQQIQSKLNSFISIPLIGKQDTQFKSDIETYRLRQFG